MALSAVKGKLNNLIIGEELIIETEKEMLIGRLQNVDVNLNFVVLSAVRDLKHNVLYTSVQLIPVKRINCIRQVRNEECFLESSTENTKSDSSGGSSSTAEHVQVALNLNEPHQLAKTTLTQYELQLFQKHIGAVKVLSICGSDYNDAIADIKSRNIVALDVQPHRSGRNRKTAIITIATENCIYVFDIIMLGEVFEDLKALLRAERPQKAVHNSRTIADHFEYRHNLQLGGISDTLVAYCIITKKKANIELEDVVTQHFGIAKDFFTRLDESHIMYSRPLNESLVRNCAKRAAFVFKLNECFHKTMLRKYYSQCKNFSRTYADNEDSAEVANLIETRDDEGHQHIQPLDLDDQSL